MTRRGAVLLASLLALPAAVVAQGAKHVALGPQFVVGSYREVEDEPRYEGVGFGAGLLVTWRRFTAEVVYASIDYEPEQADSGVQGFTASQLDGVLRYALSSHAGIEVGAMRRDIDPELTVESMSAVRLGARLSHLLRPGARVSARGTYLAASKFSRGGSAPFAFEVGLGFLGELAHGRVRLSAEYEFLRIDRKTDVGGTEFTVPIQQWLMRAGAGVAF